MPDNIEERLVRIETKLDQALEAIRDHEARLRRAESHGPNKAEVIRILIGALLALAGVGAGRIVWGGG